jgi:hypothetical protein
LYGLIANWKPGHQKTWVDYDLDDRAPLLFIMGGKDHLMPPSVNRSNAKKYRNSEATTETYEFPDPHTSRVARLAGSRWPTTRSTRRRATRECSRPDNPRKGLGVVGFVDLASQRSALASSSICWSIQQGDRSAGG